MQRFARMSHQAQPLEPGGLVIPKAQIGRFELPIDIEIPNAVLRCEIQAEREVQPIRRDAGFGHRVFSGRRHPFTALLPVPIHGLELTLLVNAKEPSNNAIRVDELGFLLCR